MPRPNGGVGSLPRRSARRTHEPAPQRFLFLGRAHVLFGAVPCCAFLDPPLGKWGVRTHWLLDGGQRRGGRPCCAPARTRSAKGACGFGGWRAAAALFSTCWTSCFSEIVRGLKRAREALVARTALVAHRHEVAMHGIDAFLARAGRDVPGHETSGLARRLGRDLLEHIRGCIETLDQRAELILDAGHAGKLRLGAAKLLTHLGKLLLDGSEIVELWRLPERFAQLVCDLVEACVHRLDRRRGHDRAERMFELMGTSVGACRRAARDRKRTPRMENRMP